LRMSTEAEAYAQTIGQRKTLEPISLEKIRWIEESCENYE
jgi:hypothetical protein